MNSKARIIYDLVGLIKRSPKGGSGEPVGLASVILGQITNVVFPCLVNHKQKHREGKSWGTVVHKDVVSEAKTNI